MDRLQGVVKELNAPFSIVAAHSSLIDGPDVLKDKLDKHGLEVSAFQVFAAEDPLGFGIEVEVSPKDFLEYGTLYAELLLVEGSELSRGECPAIDGAAEDDVVVLGAEIDVFVVLFFVLGGSIGGGDTFFIFDDRGLGVVAFGRRVFFLDGVDALFHAFPPVQVVHHALALEKASHDSVDLLNQFAEVGVRFLRAHLQLGN